MKIWYGYGSEHSMNLVMIGEFKEESDAGKAKQIIDWLTEQVNTDVQAGLLDVGNPPGRYTPRMLELLGKANLFIIGPTELEQFTYDVRLRVEGKRIVLTTDEADVSAFCKVLIDQGARVEMYSAHDYGDTAYGRGR
jgi:hypothetical protein